jgi:hypothetical protein
MALLQSIHWHGMDLEGTNKLLTVEVKLSFYYCWRSKLDVIGLQNTLC